MTIQAVLAFLVAFPRRPSSPSDQAAGTDVPLWERHPAEQQYLRQKAHDEQRLWARIPRSW